MKGAKKENEMRYPASETAEKHTRILNEAARLFRERGFSGVSVNEIMKATGLTHGPFYNHFSSKEELMAESIELAMEASLAALDSAGHSAEGKERYISNYLSMTHCDSLGSGCAMAALGSQIRYEPAVRGPFTRQLKATIDKMTSWFPSRSKRTARSCAIQTAASMVGALMLARAVDDPALAEEILHEVQQGLS
jgi:TetR/AcrR family transcriptional regulator, transcriptional repressor for nem operon